MTAFWVNVARPKLKNCIFCGKPAIKLTCGGTACRAKQRKQYMKKRHERSKRKNNK